MAKHRKQALKRETEIHKKLDHSKIVKLYEWLETEN